MTNKDSLDWGDKAGPNPTTGPGYGCPWCERIDDHAHEFVDILSPDCEHELATLRTEVHQLNIARREGRGLLQRMVKYVREDRAVTPGSTRLARLAAQVDDYLNRTHKPSDVLR